MVHYNARDIFTLEVCVLRLLFHCGTLGSLYLIVACRTRWFLFSQLNIHSRVNDMSDKTKEIVQFLDETKKLLEGFMKYLENIENRIQKIETQLASPPT